MPARWRRKPFSVRAEGTPVDHFESLGGLQWRLVKRDWVPLKLSGPPTLALTRGG
jgi:hypothetical protein